MTFQLCSALNVHRHTVGTRLPSTGEMFIEDGGMSPELDWTHVKVMSKIRHTVQQCESQKKRSRVMSIDTSGFLYDITVV